MADPFDPTSIIPPDTDLAALRGVSTTVRLHNPEAVEVLRYDFDSLAALEETYGTLQAMSARIKDAVFTHLPIVIAAGLRHTGDPTLMDGKALRRRLDLSEVGDLGMAFSAAFVASFGALIKDTDAPGEATAPTPAPSRGGDGSGQPSSTSASDPTTSGA